MLILLTLCAESGKATTRKEWDSQDPIIDDGRMNVYRETLRQYQGKMMDEREKITQLMNSIHDDLGWNGYYYHKKFNTESYSSD